MDSNSDKSDYTEPYDVSRLHAAAAREKQPAAPGNKMISLPVLVATCGILMASGAYFGSQAKSLGYDSVSSLTSSNLLKDPRPKAAGAGEELPPFEKAMKDGARIYATCIGCHGPTGGGTPGVFPPLDGSEWVTGSTERLALILLKGVAGPMTVKGTNYNSVMASPVAASPDKDVAAVMTYIRNSWGNSNPEVITAEMVKAAREKHKDFASPATEETLKTIPDDAMLEGGEVAP